jgi:hypothetical protein
MKEIGLGKSGKSATVDDEDYEYLSQWHWFCNNHGYAIRPGSINGRRHMFYMHRVIMNTPDNMEADYINHEKLDNRRINLRNCTPSQNQSNCPLRKTNTSGVKGVCWDKSRKKWQALVVKNYKTYHVGRFDRFEDAVSAYQTKAKELFGEFYNE